MRIERCDRPGCRLCQMADDDGWEDTGHPVAEATWADVAGMMAVVILFAIFFVLVVQL